MPPRHPAQLLTEEKSTVPSNAIALISMEAKLKLRGLINVSGFSVDSGFFGRLKFAVHNSGTTAVCLKPGQQRCLLGHCDLHQTTNAVCDGSHQAQDSMPPTM